MLYIYFSALEPNASKMVNEAPKTHLILCKLLYIITYKISLGYWLDMIV
jgi:hypothetical protein